MRSRLMLSTMLVATAAASLAASQALAQTTQGGPEHVPGSLDNTAPVNSNGQTVASSGTSEVVVTGSRIRAPNLTSASPITAVSAQELKLEGNSDIINAITQIPQNSGSLGNNPNPLNGTGGYTTANLRGLGSVRTLVLIDGKRVMPGDPTTDSAKAADLDQIPQNLVDRIEVVTGGAGAVYGSDAVAGVVNFVLKKNFQGVQADGQYGFSTHDNSNTFIQNLEKKAGFPAPSGTVRDAETWNVNLLLGVNTPDQKGNVEVYLDYRHQDPSSEGNRDYSACLLTAAQLCSGSGTSNRIASLDNGKSYSVVGTSLLSYPQAGSSPPPLFNSSPYEYLQRQDERYLAGFQAHYDFSPLVQVYSTFNFMDDRSQSVVAPGGVFFGTGTAATGTFTVPCNSPLLSAQEVGVLCTANGLGATDSASLLIGRRNVEGGGRIADYEHLSYRGVAGVRGDLGAGWNYDVSAQYGYTLLNNRQLNYFSTQGFQNALNAGTYHLFTQGGVTAADLSTVNSYGTASGSTTEQVLTATVGGDLGRLGIKSPFANDPVAVSFGTEYRREALDYLADLNLGSGDLNGGSGASPPINGSFDVYDLFGEARAPLVQDRPFVHDLNVSYGYRFSQYSTAGNVDAIKYAAEYAPTRDLRFRGSYQRSVRAPSLQELLVPQVVTQTSSPGVDPCAPTVAADGTTVIAASASLAACQRTAGSHITAAQIATLYGNGGTTNQIIQCPAQQCAYAFGGNSNLAPEISDTVSYGFIFTPTFFRNFDMSVDYFNINVKGAISNIDPGVILNQCLNNNNLCNLVNRSAQGNIFGNQIAQGGYIVATNANVGFFRTSGIDVSSHYLLNLSDVHLNGFGRLLFSLDGTYQNNYIISPAPGLGTYNCAGLFGSKCGLTPRWKSKARVTYQMPYGVELSGQWRYTARMKLDTNTSQPLIAGAYDAFDRRIPAVSYFDLTLLYRFMDRYQARLGVSNVADKSPPLVAQGIFGTGTPNTSPDYDTLGRTFFFGVTANF